jgi:3-deoxy-D-manno-octulosonate 8-phosphate phosphatase (KDO 8-P phosphatase)
VSSSRAPASAAPRRTAELAARARRVRLVLLDVDGVLTDGTVLVDARGRELRAFATRDADGIALLLRAGIRVAILSRRSVAGLARRARALALSAVVQGSDDKLAAARRLCRRWRLGLAEACAVSDDCLDEPLLASVGLAVGVAGGASGLARHLHWRTGAAGGAGVAYEVAEVLLRAQGRWASVLGDAMR